MLPFEGRFLDINQVPKSRPLGPHRQDPKRNPQRLPLRKQLLYA